MTYVTDSNSGLYGLAAGDLNNDGRLDIAVTNYGTYAVGIFLAHIETNFVENTTFSTGSAEFPGFIALDGFTSDGLPDIVVENDGTHDISILIHNANGKFSMQTAYLGNSTFCPPFIIVSDFNSDQRLDIAAANCDMNILIILYGERDVTFDNFTVFSTGTNSNPQSTASGYFNNDNCLDVIVRLPSSNAIDVLLGYDNGIFGNSMIYSTGRYSYPLSVTIKDLNNDGRLDVVVSNMLNNNIGICLGYANEDFASTTTTRLVGHSAQPVSIALGDFNSDSNVDVGVADRKTIR